MWDFSIGRSIGMVLRTWPFVLLRAVVYSLVLVCYLLLIGTGAGVGYGLGFIFSDDAFIGTLGGGAVGFGIGMYLFRLVSQYILYIVKAGHVAVFVELMDGRPVPGAFGQIEHGRKVVTERFAEASTLFVLDQLIKGVLRVISGIFRGLNAMIPIPGLKIIFDFINMVVSLSLTYADEVILAWNIRSGVNEPWETSRRGLVLYAQNGKTILKNAFWLAVFIWAIAIAFFIFAIAPAGALLYYMPGHMAGWSMAVAIGTTIVFVLVFIEPFAIASLMQVYFKVTEGQTPDPQWDARLSDASAQFRELKDKAVGQWGFGPNTTRADT